MFFHFLKLLFHINPTKRYVLADVIIFNMRSHIIEFGTPKLRPLFCVPNTRTVNYLKFNSVLCNFAFNACPPL